MWPKITTNYSPNFTLTKRSKNKIKYIVIHYTGMKKEIAAIKKLCDDTSKVSAHYFIKSNGNILNLVPDLYEAWHAGKSKWKNKKLLNKYSIGIEIHNPGHEFNYKKFSTKQINSLKKLLKSLVKIHKINTKNILAHSDIAPDRKKDPGEKFPWKDLAKAKLFKWHELDDKKLKKLRSISLNSTQEKNFLKNLQKIGYNYIRSYKYNHKNKFTIKAFQRKFRQILVNGVSDQECLEITKSLLKS